MQPCWTKIINAIGFICWTFDIYEVDIYLFSWGSIAAFNTVRSYHDE